jgi:hypothetical protein
MTWLVLFKDISFCIVIGACAGCAIADWQFGEAHRSALWAFSAVCFALIALAPWEAL